MCKLNRHGVRWKVTADFEPLLDAVLAAPARAVKESPAKLVTVHEIDGVTYYVKRYRHASVPLRPLKFFFKPSQSRREWDLARQIEERGIPVVRHVALGERWSASGLQESTLITEGFDGVPLDDAPNVNLIAVLAFVHGMHERGVLQRDLHPGNILVNTQTGVLQLVDVHGTVIRSRVREREQSDNLAFLRIFLPIPVGAEIAARSARMRSDYLAYRSKRCLKRNREFAPKRIGGLKWQVRLPFWNGALVNILKDPDAFLSQTAEILKPGRSATVGRADGFVLKRYNLRKFASLLKDLFRPSRARRAFRKSYHLELVGIPTARPIAVAERRACRFLLRSFFLMQEIPGATHINNWTRDRREAVRRVAELLAHLHIEGFTHRDLKESNIVFDAHAKAHLIDLEGLRYVGRISNRRAAADLERLRESAEQIPDVTRADYVRFLLRYCKVRKLNARALREN